MKILMLIFTLVTLTVYHSSGQSQKDDKISIGAEFGLPNGQAANYYSSIVGLSLKLEIPISNSAFNFTVTAGFSDFTVKSTYSGYLQDGIYLPVALGGRYYFDKSVYFEGDLGGSVNVNSNYSGPQFALIYAPILGVSVPITDKSAVDFGLRYEARVETGGTVSQAALRVAYKF